MFKIELKKARENAGLTQIQLSKKLGLSNGAVGNWEAGTREPDLETIGRIASVLGVKVSELVDTNNTEQNNKALPEGLNPETDRAYFSVMKTAKDKGFSPHDVKAAIDLLEYARKRDKEDK